MLRVRCLHIFRVTVHLRIALNSHCRLCVVKYFLFQCAQYCILIIIDLICNLPQITSSENKETYGWISITLFPSARADNWLIKISQQSSI